VSFAKARDLLKQPIPVPKGWSTREDVAKELECSPSRASIHLSDMAAAGLVERRKHATVNEDGTRIHLFIYRLTGKACRK
jgi:Mn-dependent DtxR family transcriptional regulator